MKCSFKFKNNSSCRVLGKFIICTTAFKCEYHVSQHEHRKHRRKSITAKRTSMSRNTAELFFSHVTDLKISNRRF